MWDIGTELKMSIDKGVVEGRTDGSIRYRITAIQFPEYAGTISFLLQHKNYKVSGLFNQEQLKLLISQLQTFVEE